MKKNLEMKHKFVSEHGDFWGYTEIELPIKFRGNDGEEMTDFQKVSLKCLTQDVYYWARDSYDSFTDKLLNGYLSQEEVDAMCGNFYTLDYIEPLYIIIEDSKEKKRTQDIFTIICGSDEIPDKQIAVVISISIYSDSVYYSGEAKVIKPLQDD